jgi:hypothetical protein
MLNPVALSIIATPGLKECQHRRENPSVKAPVATNNVHSGFLAEAQGIDQPWGANLPAMLTGASIAHPATIANGLFEASVSRRSHGDLVATVTVRAGLSPFSSRHTGWRGDSRRPVLYLVYRVMILAKPLPGARIVVPEQTAHYRRVGLGLVRFPSTENRADPGSGVANGTNANCDSRCEAMS